VKVVIGFFLPLPKPAARADVNFLKLIASDRLANTPLIPAKAGIQL